jgi:hypothetical protein
MKAKEKDVIVTTQEVHRVCGYVEKGTEGIIDEEACPGYWIKFPGHPRTIKLYKDEFEVKEK